MTIQSIFKSVCLVGLINCAFAQPYMEDSQERRGPRGGQEGFENFEGGRRPGPPPRGQQGGFMDFSGNSRGGRGSNCSGGSGQGGSCGRGPGGPGAWQNGQGNSYEGSTEGDYRRRRGPRGGDVQSQ